MCLLGNSVENVCVSVYELWFKQILFEIDSVQDIFGHPVSTTCTILLSVILGFSHTSALILLLFILLKLCYCFYFCLPTTFCTTHLIYYIHILALSLSLSICICTHIYIIDELRSRILCCLKIKLHMGFCCILCCALYDASFSNYIYIYV